MLSSIASSSESEKLRKIHEETPMIIEQSKSLISVKKTRYHKVKARYLHINKKPLSNAEEQMSADGNTERAGRAKKEWQVERMG